MSLLKFEPRGAWLVGTTEGSRTGEVTGSQHRGPIKLISILLLAVSGK